jgi:hypothetical protein
MTNNTQPQLPAEVTKEIQNLAEAKMLEMDRKIKEGISEESRHHFLTGYTEGVAAGATEYAAKLLDCDKVNAALEEKVRGLEEWKSQAMYLLDPLYEYGDKSKEIKLGESITTFILNRCEKYEAARALLEKFISRHEAGLLPDRFIYDEIKTFLDGK